MNLELLEIIICPHCKAKIELLESKKIQNQNILDGLLCCISCRSKYPIWKGIPDFLPNKSMNKALGDKCDKNIQVKQANIVYYDAMAKNYDKDISTFGIFQPYTQSRIAEILEYIRDTTDGKTLLDFGCGTGNILSIAQNYFQQSIGIDISKEMLIVARDRDFEVLRGDVESTPFDDCIADSVTCFSLLHHLYEQKWLFSEAYRLLRVGGVFYSDYDPNHTSKVLQHSRLFIFAKKVFEMIYRNKINVVKGSVLSEAHKLAEYHHWIKDGLNPVFLKTQLESIGFKDIKIIPHGNCASVKKNTFWHIPVAFKIAIALKFLVSWRLSYSYLAPQFLILARK